MIDKSALNLALSVALVSGITYMPQPFHLSSKDGGMPECKTDPCPGTAGRVYNEDTKDNYDERGTERRFYIDSRGRGTGR